MKILFLFTLIFIIGSACNEPTESVNKQVKKSTSDTLFEGIIDTALVGIYSTVLPCSDCKGRQHTVMLNADGTFRLEEMFLGKNMRPSVTRGEWQRHEDEVRLTSGNLSLFTYLLENDSLKISEPQGEKTPEITYYLEKKPTNKSTAWQEKGKSGIDFFGVGTEPFWSISIDNEDSVVLQFAARKAPIKVKTPEPNDFSDSLVYEVKNKNSVAIRVTIYPHFCSDGMSDFTYEQSVHIWFENMKLEGCGRFFYEPRSKSPKE